MNKFRVMFECGYDIDVFAKNRSSAFHKAKRALSKNISRENNSQQILDELAAQSFKHARIEAYNDT